MQRRPGSSHAQSINHDLSPETNTLLVKLPLEKLQPKKPQISPASTSNMLKSSRNKNYKGYPSTQYGTMLSNCYQACPAPYQDGCYHLPKKRSLKQRNSSKNTCDETQSDHHGAHMQPTSFLSKRKTVNSDQYKTTVHSTSGQRKTETYPHSSHPSSTDSQDAPYSPNSISDGVTITYTSNWVTNGRPPSLHLKGCLSPP